jgi:hypothetical protein
VDAGLRGLIAAQVLGPDRLAALRLLAEHVRPKLTDRVILTLSAAKRKDPCI